MMRRPWMIIMLFCGIFACSHDNSLSGSLGDVVSLTVSSVDIRQNNEAFQVTYYQNRGAFLDVVARVSVATAGVNFTPGSKIDLSGEFAPGHLRTTVTTAPGGEPERQLPPVQRGDLQLESGGTPGEAARGSFSILFQEGAGDLGGGRTLNGNFNGMAMDAGFGVIP